MFAYNCVYKIVAVDLTCNLCLGLIVFVYKEDRKISCGG